MIEDWDLSDSDESGVVPSDGLINFFKKKEAIIELSAMIERQKRPMTATEIQRLFRHEFHQDFPYFHFGFNSMGKFLDDIRGVVHDGNLPDGTRLYIADPRYKYHLLRAMARGGCAADGANEKGATAVLNKNTNVGAVVAHLVQPAVQQMAHKNEGDFGFPSRGRRGMTWITPVENGSGPSRFSGVPKTPSHPPADPPVMPQNAHRPSTSVALGHGVHRGVTFTGNGDAQPFNYISAVLQNDRLRRFIHRRTPALYDELVGYVYDAFVEKLNLNK